MWKLWHHVSKASSACLWTKVSPSTTASLKLTVGTIRRWTLPSRTSCLLKHLWRWMSTALVQDFLMGFLCSQLDIMMKYRYGTIFRKIFHTEVDWCDIVGQVNANKVVMKFASLLKDSAPNIFRPCPHAPVNHSILKRWFYIFVIPGPFRRREFDYKRQNVAGSDSARTLQTRIHYNRYVVCCLQQWSFFGLENVLVTP